MPHLRPIILILLITLLWSTGGLVTAQDDDGLNPEEHALVERARAAILAAQDYPSLTATTIFDDAEEAEISLGDTVVQRAWNEKGTSTYAMAYDAAGKLNLVSKVTLDYEHTTNDTTTRFVLEAERRIVDGALYVLATRTPAELPDLPPVPTGWTLVEDAADFLALQPLELDEWLKNIDIPGIFAPTMDEVLDHVTTITLEEDVVYEDIIVDIIEYHLQGADLRTATVERAAAEGDTQASTMFAVMDERSFMTIRLYLNADDQIVQMDANNSIVLNDIDFTLMSPNAPAGARYSGTFTGLRIRTIRDIGAPLEPVAVPELGALE